MTFAATCRALEALASTAAAAGDLAAAEALRGALATVRDVGGWRIFGRAPSSSSSGEAGPTLSGAAARARRYRENRKRRDAAAESSRPSVTEDVTETVTRHAPDRDASRPGRAPSPSLFPEKKELKEREREEESSSTQSPGAGAREATVTRDASRLVTPRKASRVTDPNGPEHPAGDLTPAPWAAEVLETVRISTGRSFGDVPVVWAHFVAHLAAKGWPVTRNEWLKWCTSEVKRNAAAAPAKGADGLLRPKHRGQLLQPVDPDAPWMKPVRPAEGDDYDGR